MKKQLMILPLVLILCFMLGCQKQEQVERFMEDGVEVVVNHLEPYKIEGEPNTLHLEEEFTIDPENDDIAETGLTEIFFFDVDSEGSLYCQNRWIGEDVVFKFDKNGNFIASFGSRGQGPGEIINSYDLRVDYKDEIVIKDITGKILYFGKDGSFKKQIKVDQSLILGLPLENGNYLVQKQILHPDE